MAVVGSYCCGKSWAFPLAHSQPFLELLDEQRKRACVMAVWGTSRKARKGWYTTPAQFLLETWSCLAQIVKPHQSRHPCPRAGQRNRARDGLLELGSNCGHIQKMG